MASVSRIWKFVKTNLPREKDHVYLLGRAFDFSRFFTTSFEFCAVDRNVFYHLSPRPAPPLLLPYHIISAVTALQAAGQLEVTCLFGVLRIEHLSIYRLTCLSIFLPRLLLLA